jgi:drug/metabolite transporter (DMT)-like permease
MPRVTLKSTQLWYSPAVWVLAAALIWTTDAVVRPRAVGLSASHLVFLEHLFGLLVVAPVTLVRYGKQALQLTLRELGLISLIGLGGAVLGNILYTKSSQSIGAGIPTLIGMAQPAAVVGLAYVFLKERMDSAFFPLSFWVILNALLIAYPLLEVGVDPNLSDEFYPGVGLAILASFMWALATVSGKALLKSQAPLVAVFWRWAAAVLGLGASIGLQSNSEWPSMTVIVADLVPLLYLAVVAGILPMFLYYKGLQRMPASLATFIELIYPLGGVFLTAVLSRQPVSVLQLIGGVTLVMVLGLLAWTTLVSGNGSRPG